MRHTSDSPNTNPKTFLNLAFQSKWLDIVIDGNILKASKYAYIKDVLEG